jgi:F0F1-type ATP synthase epsilon subunit
MNLKIITPDENEIIKDNVGYVNLHLSNGYPISIYPGHIQLAAALQEGRINYLIDNTENDVSVSRGLLLVEKDTVSCYVSWAHAVIDGQKRQEEK